MNLFIDIDIYIFSIVFLGIVCINAYNKLNRKVKINCLFIYIASGILIGVTCEMLTYIISKKPDPWLIPINNLLNIILFIACPVVTYLWYKFTKSWINSESSLHIKFKNILLIPLYIDVLATLSSPFTGLVFSVTSDNIYHRGPLYIIPTAAIYLYLTLGFILVIKNRNSIYKEDIFPLLLFGLLPALGGLGQLLYYGVHLIWTSASFSIIIVFIFLQQRMMQIESLTRAWTRLSFDQYLEKRLYKDRNTKFGIIYIDMDDFKNINDTYGHQEGDIALKTAVSLLKSVLSSNDILARYGGDEFIILTDKANLVEIERMVNDINEQFNNYNINTNKKYHLSFSSGYEVYEPEKYTISQFINHVDRIMYQNKQEKNNSL